MSGRVEDDQGDTEECSGVSEHAAELAPAWASAPSYGYNFRALEFQEVLSSPRIPTVLRCDMLTGIGDILL